MNKYNWQPIIILGAGRSGTSILQSVIGSHPKAASLAPDINFVWRYKNMDAPDDQLEELPVDKKIKDYIHKYFNKHSQGREYVVEKSVCNTIRIPFVYDVFPNAKFIYIQRNGIDVIASVKGRWGQIRDRKYLIRKIKAFPKRDALTYGLKYAINLLKIKVFNQPVKGYIWGVKYPGYEKDLEQLDTLSTIMKQWKICMEKSLQDLQKINKDQVFFVNYEEMVKNPKKIFKELSFFLNLPFEGFETSSIHPNKINSFNDHLTEKEVQRVKKFLDNDISFVKS